MTVQIAPARLHHADFGIGEVIDGAAQKIDGRNKIGIEDRNDFAGSRLQAILQSARFIAVAIAAVNVLDGQAVGAVFRRQPCGELVSFVGGIVEHLNLQQFAWIIQLARFLDQAFDHVLFVVDGKLHRDAR